MKLVNNRTLQLETFYDERRPQYAILSHTWDEEEVLFQDMTDLSRRETVKKMKGFGKIERTCTTALAEGIAYSWVDTCCIDKSSSAELSEAINSMFRWYSDARVCYVDLPDLQLEDDETGEETPKNLSHCRWFTRGWTLQELIAPRFLRFFSLDWSLSWEKNDILTHLVEITGIPEEVLRRDADALEDASAAQKMSWASSRETTRVEDMAYCLLGLFDINMPLLYGEGPKAFDRLQEEILTRRGDMSLLAWTSARPAEEFRGMFAQSPYEFRDCGEIYPVSRLDWGFNSTFTTSSQGILVTGGHVFKGNGKDSILLLFCCAGNGGDFVYVYIRKTSGGFVRSIPDATHALEGPEEASPLPYSTQTIFNMAPHLSSLDCQLIRQEMKVKIELCPPPNGVILDLATIPPSGFDPEQMSVLFRDSNMIFLAFRLQISAPPRTILRRLFRLTRFQRQVIRYLGVLHCGDDRTLDHSLFCVSSLDHDKSLLFDKALDNRNLIQLMAAIPRDTIVSSLPKTFKGRNLKVNVDDKLIKDSGGQYKYTISFKVS